MKTTVDKKAKTLTITIDLVADPQPSSSGKSVIIASTFGPTRTDQSLDGKPITVNLNAYVKA